jgi:hypothetical protein
MESRGILGIGVVEDDRMVDERFRRGHSRRVSPCLTGLRIQLVAAGASPQITKPRVNSSTGGLCPRPARIRDVRSGALFALGGLSSSAARAALGRGAVCHQPGVATPG